MAGAGPGGPGGMTADRLGAMLGEVQDKEARRALKRVLRKGGEAAEEDCHPLFGSLVRGTGGLASDATVALPVVLALACDPGMGARVTLVELVACLAKAAAGPGPVDAGWHEAWRSQRPRLRALLADPRPEVRREALSLPVGAGALLERWHTETDPAVRLPLLLALGTAAGSGPAGAGAVDRVRAVVREVLRTGDPVLRVAAVHAWASFDPRVPVRELDLLVEVLSDASTRPLFEAVWYAPDIDGAFTREDVVSWTALLFEDEHGTALSFAVRLIETARRTGDAPLCRAALDEAWRVLVVRPSAAPALLPLAGALLRDPDEGVRFRAAHLLAVLGPRSAEYADELAALLDDPGGAEFLEGTVGDHARWALTRIGDPRGLPGLVERLCAPYEGHYSRSYVMGDPRLPEIEDVLTPLGAHADALLPAVRARLRGGGADGAPVGRLLEVLTAWGPAAAPALPEVVALLGDTRWSLTAVDVLVAMGPAASSAADAVRGCAVLDHPGNRLKVAWAVWRLGGDRDTALRLIGEAVLAEEGSVYAPVGLLGDFGPAAAPYAAPVRHAVEHGPGWLRLRAAPALWSITGEREPSVSVLEEYVVPPADGDDSYGCFLDALRALTGIGTVSPGTRDLLRAARESDRRLSSYRDYRAFLRDEEIRSAIEDVLALP
ncbi:hypothetical protein [Streptomyces sp. PsTaAH-124]|uniref:hypothetical protein n=1 Tax=Streptomyces sp. PsTaAH-124 TaxID=1157638 RepID=UPI00131A28A8|nr:hypothetical protein [Streptomyces sp. PsTaAH-124]